MSAQKKRNFQIEAFKHRVMVDPKYTENTWMILEHAIKEICNQNASGHNFEEPYSWHHKVMLFEQYHWKRTLKKGQTCKFKWNEYMDKDHKDAYYINWPVYFP